MGSRESHLHDCMHMDPSLIKKIQYSTSWDSFWLQTGAIKGAIWSLRSRNMYSCIWIYRGSKMAPHETPLNTEVRLPPESHFGSSSFICEMWKSHALKIPSELANYVPTFVHLSWNFAPPLASRSEGLHWNFASLIFLSLKFNMLSHSGPPG